jgi:hypothetical protein
MKRPVEILPGRGWWLLLGAGGADPSTTSLRVAVPLPVPGRNL